MAHNNRSAGIFVFALLVALVGWNPASSASAFTEALTEDYFELARLDYYYSDDKFAVKARAADEGKNVLPYDPAQQEGLPAESREELVSAHGRLMEALNGGFREQDPRQASKAQTMFDCWLWAVIDREERCIEKCRKGFFTALAAWTPPVAAAPPPAPKPKPMAKPKPKPAPAPAPRSFIVFFDWDSANVRPDARRVLETAAAYAKERGLARVNLVGHADRSGAAKYNLGLSLRRADAVKAALVGLGIEAAGVAVSARGETVPLVGTADGVREPRNRRVEITF